MATLRVQERISTASISTSGSREKLVLEETTHDKPTSKKKEGLKKSKTPAYVAISRCIVDNKYFIAFTTLLTIYALSGDDFRLWLTPVAADEYFDYCVWSCIIVFTIEVILSCLGKADYYPGFFFFLDVISTVTLVLDLSFISDEMSKGGEDESSGQSADGTGSQNGLKSGRTARVGAKAGRVVRVLRLVRILKLYKAFYEAQARKKARAEREKERKERGEEGQDDDWDDEDMEEAENPEKFSKESRVGKKLSEVTTRRVIFLILSSLMVPPLIAQQPAEYFDSPHYGADTAVLAFEEYLNDKTDYNRDQYENEMLRMVLYHNWFSEKIECKVNSRCPEYYYGHLFWFGVRGSDEARVKEYAELGQVRRSAVDSFMLAAEQEFRTEDSANSFIFNYGHIPQALLNQVSGPWDTDCSESASKVTYKFGVSLLRERSQDMVDYPITCAKGRLRKREYYFYESALQNRENATAASIYFLIDMRNYIQEDAVYNISMTCFVCFLLCAASLTFARDANMLVLNPVENMIRRVEAIRDNPLIAMKMADEEFKLEEIARAKLKRATAGERVRKMVMDIVTGKIFQTAKSEPMETMILEKTIIKLGSLLALGFGEAGANIIGANMSNSDSTGVNVMISGVRVDCIIGMARVRNFSTATEVLQAKIMTFVNQIAEIVHGVVNEYHGAANKNYGEMFLIIWQIRGVEKHLQRIAEMSVAAFARVLGGLHRNPVLASYRGHPGLQLRLGSDCRVHMSFGLHKGWAIEGAVGSEFKIDASYLSPNINIARSIETATTTYGVPLVIGHSVLELCKPKLAAMCRLIDRVIIIGSPAPMHLYSLDLDFNSLTVDNAPPLKLAWSTRQRFRARQFLEVEKSAKLAEDMDVVEHMESHPDFERMRRRYTIEFLEMFKMGYENYSQGEWQVARRMLSQTRTMLRVGYEDGPSVALLKFMEVPHQFEAPIKWQGVRDLNLGDEKARQIRTTLGPQDGKRSLSKRLRSHTPKPV